MKKESLIPTDSFDSYCSRMWLDYCDENNTLYSNHMTKDEYVERWYDWLLDKYQNRNSSDYD